MHMGQIKDTSPDPHMFENLSIVAGEKERLPKKVSKDMARAS